MTNKELAKRAKEAVRTASLIKDGMTDIDRALRMIEEAADRLATLPDPTPTTPDLETQMREVVEKHECLRERLVYLTKRHFDDLRWSWQFDPEIQSGTCVTTSAALTVIRGIVKAKCNERGGNWDWRLAREHDGWTCFCGSIFSEPASTIEIEAIDALLTAMEGGDA